MRNEIPKEIEKYLDYIRQVTCATISVDMLPKITCDWLRDPKKYKEIIEKGVVACNGEVKLAEGGLYDIDMFKPYIECELDGKNIILSYHTHNTIPQPSPTDIYMMLIEETKAKYYCTGSRLGNKVDVYCIEYVQDRVEDYVRLARSLEEVSVKFNKKIKKKYCPVVSLRLEDNMRLFKIVEVKYLDLDTLIEAKKELDEVLEKTIGDLVYHFILEC